MKARRRRAMPRGLQPAEVRRELLRRLSERREELEQAALTRVAAIADPGEIVDPTYAEGLRRAVSAAIDYGLETIDVREDADPPIPVDLLAQARLAARNGITLDTVLRRYFAGYSLFGYFVLEEATHAGVVDGTELKRLLTAYGRPFDRLIAAVGEEYAREAEAALRASTKRRQTKRIERLLAGEIVDTAGIAYDFDGQHLGLLAEGAEAERRVREAAARLDCYLLCVPREGDALWAWLGTHGELDPVEVLHSLSRPSADVACAAGEPGRGLAGWRLTHRQAAAALRIARCGPERLVRYADVALLASALQDDLLAASLRRIYIEPLREGRDDGVSLLQTLRAYLQAGGSLSGAAVVLGVSRQTVRNRLQRAEHKLQKPIYTALAEIGIALRLEEFEDAAAFPK